jgi:hypothetical protein
VHVYNDLTSLVGRGRYRYFTAWPSLTKVA